jgi:hypothetical protein
MPARWALHDRDVKVVQGWHLVLRRVKLREGAGEPLEQFGPRPPKGLLFWGLELRAHNAHGQWIDIAADDVCPEAGCLNQGRPSTGEGVQHTSTFERAITRTERLPELLGRGVCVEVASDEQAPKQRGRPTGPPSVNTVNWVADSPIGADDERELSEWESVLE